jgi:hypothetical protein
MRIALCGGMCETLPLVSSEEITVMSDSAARYRTNWQDEIESAALYRVIGELEPNPNLANVYLPKFRPNGGHDAAVER